MGGDVRTTVGVPKLSAFANGSGTPLVIDTATGVGYFTDKNQVLPLEAPGGSVTPSVNAATPATQVFTSGVDTKITGYTTPQTPNVPAEWNGATGEFTVAKSGWYDVAAWVSVGQFVANSLNVNLAAANPSAVNYPIAGAAVYAPAGGLSYITATCSTPAYLAAGSKVWLIVNIAWDGGVAHPNSDGATQFTVAYLHP